MMQVFTIGDNRSSKVASHMIATAAADTNHKAATEFEC